jgi:ribosomal protein L11 methyltransferase
MTDAGDEPLLEPAPGTAPLWRDVRVTALIPADLAGSELRTRIAAAIAPRPCPPLVTSALAERDWVRESLARFAPMRFGTRLCVCPSWCEPPADAQVVVTLDPGVAFGTGTHPSTALCLEWLDAAPLSGVRVIDYGCGSGVLGIAALALGAAAVDAVDIDPQARAAALDNAGRNSVGERLAVHAPGAPLAPAAVLVANILAGPLVELAGTLSGLLGSGGRIALAGITAGQVEEVAAAYGRAVAWAPPRARGDWALLHGVRA